MRFTKSQKEGLLKRFDYSNRVLDTSRGHCIACDRTIYDYYKLEGACLLCLKYTKSFCEVCMTTHQAELQNIRNAIQDAEEMI